jgi:CheY-like chemotaxis protein
VLVVEDYQDAREMYAAYLQYAGFRVAEATNGLEAIEQSVALKPDIILMDLALPKVDGWEATRRLKADAELAGIPVIVISARAMPADEARAREAGCDDYLTKPLDETALFEKLERHLGR